MIVIALEFVDPKGLTGFTDAPNYHEAVKTVKEYKRMGYRFVGHFLWEN